MINQTQFLEQFNISEEDFKKSGLVWKELMLVHDDWDKIRNSFLPNEQAIRDIFVKVDKVHSVKSRIKDPGHLVDKIIRRKKTKPDAEKITVDNYRDLVHDLVGVRAMHLFKNEWENIHDFIMKNFMPIEQPVANFRIGDLNTAIYEERGCRVVERPLGYRSVHYKIPSKITVNNVIIEIQVRTIFEDGWSEIDHQIRYPNNVDDKILSGYLDIFNLFAGTADTMGTYLKTLHSHLKAKDKDLEDYEHKVKSLEDSIDKLKSITDDEKRKLQDEVKALKKTNLVIDYGPPQLTLDPRVYFGTGSVISAVMENTKLFDASKLIVGQKGICEVCGKPFVKDSTNVYAGKQLCEHHRSSSMLYTKATIK